MRRSIQILFKRPGSFFTLTKPNLLRLEEPTKIQTDGSFNIQNNLISRTAVILTKPDGVKYSLCTTYFDHANSCESEWRSVIDGLTYGIKKNVKNINLENHHLDVINSLIQKNKPSGLYSEYYYYIFELVKRFDHLAIRWIPRGLNKADKLFRI